MAISQLFWLYIGRILISERAFSQFLFCIALSNESTCLESLSWVLGMRVISARSSDSSSSSSRRSLGFRLILLKKMRILLNSFCFSSSWLDFSERLLCGKLNALKLDGILGGMIFCVNRSMKSFSFSKRRKRWKDWMRIFGVLDFWAR